MTSQHNPCQLSKTVNKNTMTLTQEEKKRKKSKKIEKHYNHGNITGKQTKRDQKTSQPNQNNRLSNSLSRWFLKIELDQADMISTCNKFHTRMVSIPLRHVSLIYRLQEKESLQILHRVLRGCKFSWCFILVILSRKLVSPIGQHCFEFVPFSRLVFWYGGSRKGMRIPVWSEYLRGIVFLLQYEVSS